MTEVIDLGLVHYLFFEIDHRLSSTDLDLPKKSQASYRKTNGQVERDLLPAHSCPDFSPLQVRRFTVDR